MMFSTPAAFERHMMVSGDEQHAVKPPAMVTSGTARTTPIQPAELNGRLAVPTMTIACERKSPRTKLELSAERATALKHYQKRRWDVAAHYPPNPPKDRLCDAGVDRPVLLAGVLGAYAVAHLSQSSAVSSSPGGLLLRVRVHLSLAASDQAGSRRTGAPRAGRIRDPEAGNAEQ